MCLSHKEAHKLFFQFIFPCGTLNILQSVDVSVRLIAMMNLLCSCICFIIIFFIKKKVYTKTRQTHKCKHREKKKRIWKVMMIRLLHVEGIWRYCWVICVADECDNQMSRCLYIQWWIMGIGIYDQVEMILIIENFKYKITMACCVFSTEKKVDGICFFN